MGEIFGGLFTSSKRKPLQYQFHQQYQQVTRHPNMWPMQESFVIPDEDEPPSIETRTPSDSYPFVTKDMERPQHFKQNRAFLSKWDNDHDQKQQQPQQQLQRKQQNQHQQVQHHQQHQLHTHYSSSPQAYYEQNRETNEIVFGAVQVQEQDGRREAMVIKAVDYGDPKYNHHNIRPRLNYMGYSSHAY
ncbi:hypothetical protein L6164_007856 [Bauhinia variegata]|nr:hypothetical protein L6164_007856 [Bauhinia variegata]